MCVGTLEMRGNRPNEANESSRHRGNKLHRSRGRNYLSVAKQRNIFISNTTSYIYLHNLSNLSSQMMGNRTSAQSQSLTMWPQHTLSDSAHPRRKHTHTKKGQWRAGRREGGRESNLSAGLLYFSPIVHGNLGPLDENPESD